MIINYNTLFWGDSILEKIQINCDKIALKIFNDVLQKHIYVECSRCIGMTQIYTWDEITIDNVFLNEIIWEQHSMCKTMEALYGDVSYDSENCLRPSFYELKILMINELSFSIICQNVTFSD